MKNVLLLLLVAGLLFAVSAGMSMWLNQPKPTEEEETPKSTKRKHGAGEKEKDDEKGHGSSTKSLVPSSPHDADQAPKTSHGETDIDRERKRSAEREAEIEQQRELYRFLLDDIRYEMEFQQKHRQKSGASGSNVPLPPSPPTKIADPPRPPDAGRTPMTNTNSSSPSTTDAPNAKKPAEPIDPKNVVKLVPVWEAMTPEIAAQTIEKLVQRGSLDLVVQVLAKMNPKQVAKVLGLVPDLMPMLIERLLELKPRETKPAAGGMP